MTFPKNIDWEATEEKYVAQFWDWCLENGYHNEDYILDNFVDLFESFAETLNDEDFIYEAQMAQRD
jgi:hypothetical protein